jgi:hypothetical protein
MIAGLIAQWELTSYLVTSIHQGLPNWTGCTLNIIKLIGMNSVLAKICKYLQKGTGTKMAEKFDRKKIKINPCA